MMEKSVHHLCLDDFRTYPIWVPVDDFEDSELAVRPHQGDSMHYEEMYLVAANIKLADGSILEGYIRFSWGEPIALAIGNKENSFLVIGIKDRSEEWSNKIAEELKRKIDDVFPLEFESSINVRLRGNAY
jgi:hypothetical protein